MKRKDELICALKIDRYSRRYPVTHSIIPLHSVSFVCAGSGLSVSGECFSSFTLVVTRFRDAFVTDLDRFFFEDCKALSCCFSRSLFFSQELHTKRRLYLGFGHISPFLWLHPIWPIQRQCLQSVSLHQMHVVGLGPGFFDFGTDPDRCFSSRFIQ